MGISRSIVKREPEYEESAFKWREDITWSLQHKNSLRRKLSNFCIDGNVDFLNCLLLGQAASGKTSFFNTCSTAIKDEGRVLAPLAVYKSSGSSVTSTFETHPIYKQDGYPLKLRLYDCRGLHDIDGVTAEDVRYIVNGNIKNGYTINPYHAISSTSEYFRSSPGLSNMMHCIVFVVNAENPAGALASQSATAIFADIRERLTPMGVPQFVLMTKIDRLRASLADDVTEVFRSRDVYRKLRIIADYMNVEESSVLPMSNYHYEVQQDMGKDILALSHLETVMDSANRFVSYTRYN